VPSAAEPTFATGLLRHTPRTAPAHYDWLLDLPLPARDGHRGEGDRVPTFRLPEPLDRCLAGVEMEAQRIVDHRRRYLLLAEPQELSGDRGTVVPHRFGRIVETNSGAATRPSGEIELTIAWRHDEAPVVQRLRLTPRGGDRWAIAVVSAT
jgi:hypothetical protein